VVTGETGAVVAFVVGVVNPRGGLALGGDGLAALVGFAKRKVDRVLAETEVDDALLDLFLGGHVEFRENLGLFLDAVIDGLTAGQEAQAGFRLLFTTF